MKLDKLSKHHLSHWLDVLGFLLPVFFSFLVSPTVLTKVYIFDITFPIAMLATIFIFGVCLFSIGCLRYKRKVRGIFPDYAGFGFWLSIGSFVGSLILVLRAPTYY
jgi:hypothetical protein